MNTSIRQLAEGRTLDEFLSALCRGREIFTSEEGEDGTYHFVRTDQWKAGKHKLGRFRPIEPLKSVLFQPREYLGRTMSGDENEPLPERIAVGVKNCDLAGLKIQDHVFLGLPPEDPSYKEAREKTILVTTDCTDCLDVCFCPVVNEQPYPKEGYDINISPLFEADPSSDSAQAGDSPTQYLIDAGGPRGEQLLDQASEYLVPADEDLVKRRERYRHTMYQRVAKQAAEHGLCPGMDLASAVRNAKESSLWSDFAADCVECGACNFVCCTCHCFLLADGLGANNEPGRGKQWDGCLLMNFARVAGGANPRAGRAARLRNRFEKKFSYFPDIINRYACDGCGRCSEVCTGNIDIRAVLKRAVDETESLHADSSDH